MLSNTPRTEIHKAPQRASQDLQQLHLIIDECLIGHVGIVQEHGPVVIPMLVWRVDDHIYLHGANNSRLMRSLAKGAATCITFTLFDGWLLARSAFHHSARYRSAVVYGQFSAIEELSEKDRLLNHFIDHIAPERSKQVRPGSTKELAATMLLAMPLTEASVKINQGDVAEYAEDNDYPVWSGFLPYRTQVGPLEPSDHTPASCSVPDYSQAYGTRWVNK
ncbi:pyridoxamine 5'-phosphate oxidase family protein [Vibrio porteresiae]|uniref:Pyridoxamine 5'-phosphate oxidase family protein n=1 Tax=Vibrio porteresiae DSM 19223 TaxID=1123496 RepID=A0ABZ0QI69_9VIBR|nr:pyridoxamine 5'-phosphate oxidase family protein [Vibrio porteresiae]WPC75412.1 pyridoxamine 5'-phosphate oxidase family protein [Vibrio porteresiae DSM 19223]